MQQISRHTKFQRKYVQRENKIQYNKINLQTNIINNEELNEFG